LLAAYVYVGYRSSYPDKETVKDVWKELRKNNVDVNQVADWTAYHCQ